MYVCHILAIREDSNTNALLDHQNERLNVASQDYMDFEEAIRETKILSEYEQTVNAQNDPMHNYDDAGQSGDDQKALDVKVLSEQIIENNQSTIADVKDTMVYNKGNHTGDGISDSDNKSSTSQNSLPEKKDTPDNHDTPDTDGIYNSNRLDEVTADHNDLEETLNNEDSFNLEQVPEVQHDSYKPTHNSTSVDVHDDDTEEAISKTDISKSKSLKDAIAQIFNLSDHEDSDEEDEEDNLEPLYIQEEDITPNDESIEYDEYSSIMTDSLDSPSQILQDEPLRETQVTQNQSTPISNGTDDSSVHGSSEETDADISVKHQDAIETQNMSSHLSNGTDDSSVHDSSEEMDADVSVKQQDAIETQNKSSQLSNGIDDSAVNERSEETDADISVKRQDVIETQNKSSQLSNGIDDSAVNERSEETDADVSVKHQEAIETQHKSSKSSNGIDDSSSHGSSQTNASELSDKDENGSVSQINQLDSEGELLFACAHCYGCRGI